MLAILITTFGSFSGAHFNLALTLAFLLRGEIGKTMAAAYVVVQVLAAMFGVVLVHLMIEFDPIQTWTKISSGGGTDALGNGGDFQFGGDDSRNLAGFGQIGCRRGRPIHLGWLLVHGREFIRQSRGDHRSLLH